MPDMAIQTRSEEAKASAPPGPRRTRWRRCPLVVAVVAILVLFRAPLLRSFAGLLVIDDPLVATDAVVVGGSNGPSQSFPFDAVAQLYREGLVREVVVLEDRSSRIVQMGILPTLETVLRRELPFRGVPESALTVLPGRYRNGWNAGRRLAEWLAEHPQAQVTMLSSQFDSRESAYVIRSALGPEAAKRVHWRVLPDMRYDVTNWWHSRQGLLRVFGAHVVLLHTYLVGEPPQGAARWDPDRYESQLRDRDNP